MAEERNSSVNHVLARLLSELSQGKTFFASYEFNSKNSGPVLLFKTRPFCIELLKLSVPLDWQRWAWTETVQNFSAFLGNSLLEKNRTPVD